MVSERQARWRLRNQNERRMMNAPDSPSCEFTTQDIEYFQHDGNPLLARMYLPNGEGPFPLVIEVHGGAWCRGDRLDEERLNQALARRGIAVAALDFRMPPQAGYPASMADINFAVRWLKASASQWRTRPDMVGLMGLSSGAHQALLAAMRPEDPRYTALPMGSPQNAAIQKYMNTKKVPQLFVGAGGSRWGDIAEFPWTMGWQPTYTTEATAFAQHILATNPKAKVGILMQNDEFGKDYQKGILEGLSDLAKSAVTQTYETSDPTVDSQIC